MPPLSCDIVLPYHSETLCWVPVAIDSVLNQQGVDSIIHVVADGVPVIDDQRIRSEFADVSNVFFYRNEKPIGPYRSLHKVYTNFQTDFIAIQDSDDISLPHRIWHSIISLQDHDADIFGGAMENFIDWKSKGSNTIERFVEGHGIIELSGRVHKYCPSGNVLNPTMVVRKKAFEELNGFADWFFNADTEFIERAHCAGKHIFTSDTVVVLRRLHRNSLCNNDQSGLHTAARRKIMSECYKRFNEFTPGFDPKKYGSLIQYSTVL